MCVCQSQCVCVCVCVCVNDKHQLISKSVHLPCITMYRFCSKLVCFSKSVCVGLTIQGISLFRNMSICRTLQCTDSVASQCVFQSQCVCVCVNDNTRHQLISKYVHLPCITMYRFCSKLEHLPKYVCVNDNTRHQLISKYVYLLYITNL